MNWTTDQLRQWEAERGPSVAQEKPRSAKPRLPYRSKTEANYAAHLDLMAKMEAAEIDSWRYEAVTLVLARGVRYTPDFLVKSSAGDYVSFHEIKGRKGAGFWALPVGKVKVRLAAALFPWWKFYVVWPGERVGTWDKILVPAK